MPEISVEAAKMKTHRFPNLIAAANRGPGLGRGVLDHLRQISRVRRWSRREELVGEILGDERATATWFCLTTEIPVVSSIVDGVNPSLDSVELSGVYSLPSRTGSRCYRSSSAAAAPAAVMGATIHREEHTQGQIRRSPHQRVNQSINASILLEHDGSSHCNGDGNEAGGGGVHEGASGVAGRRRGGGRGSRRGSGQRSHLRRRDGGRSPGLCGGCDGRGKATAALAAGCRAQAGRLPPLLESEEEETCAPPPLAQRWPCLLVNPVRRHGGARPVPRQERRRDAQREDEVATSVIAPRRADLAPLLSEAVMPFPTMSTGRGKRRKEKEKKKEREGAIRVKRGEKIFKIARLPLTPSSPIRNNKSFVAAGKVAGGGDRAPGAADGAEADVQRWLLHRTVLAGGSSAMPRAARWRSRSGGATHAPGRLPGQTAWLAIVEGVAGRRVACGANDSAGGAWEPGGGPHGDAARAAEQPGLRTIRWVCVMVDEVTGRALFYYLAKANGGSATSSKGPLLLWLNGGLGCSSLGYGTIEELGLFRVKSDGEMLSARMRWPPVSSHHVALTSPHCSSEVTMPFPTMSTGRGKE
uniref:Uncharacterized protein n=1 Tax=Oryza sativa subsp. japonica TaxID=39947 RepID=Q67VG9_ORYSJ|nr:hypothetical protein [Oryza sativa Japonica Group]